jgi:hypothetical protein
LEPCPCLNQPRTQLFGSDLTGRLHFGHSFILFTLCFISRAPSTSTGNLPARSRIEYSGSQNTVIIQPLFLDSFIYGNRDRLTEPGLVWSCAVLPILFLRTHLFSRFASGFLERPTRDAQLDSVIPMLVPNGGIAKAASPPSCRLPSRQRGRPLLAISVSPSTDCTHAAPFLAPGSV